MKPITDYRLFAATGDKLSAMGLGSVKFGRNHNIKNKSGEGKPLPSDKVLDSLLSQALELGINVIDTAPAYGTSEERLGQLLGARRERFFLMSKVGEEFDGQQSNYDFSPAHVKQSLARSLKRLKTDYLDCILVHCRGSDYQDLYESQIFATLNECKKQGLIRSFGASIYSEAACRYTLEHADAVMIVYNIKETSNASLISEAAAMGKGVFVKKALCQGFAENTRSCLDFVLANAHVTSAILGTTNINHMQDWVKTI